MGQPVLEQVLAIVHVQHWQIVRRFPAVACRQPHPDQPLLFPATAAVRVGARLQLDQLQRASSQVLAVDAVDLARGAVGAHGLDRNHEVVVVVVVPHIAAVAKGQRKLVSILWHFNARLEPLLRAATGERVDDGSVSTEPVKQRDDGAVVVNRREGHRVDV